MAKNGVPNVNFKGFMVDSAQANWNAVRAIYGDGDPSLPMVPRERTCFYQTILAVSTQTNMQGLQRRENNGRR
jgi:hypothetical protein